ESALAPLVALLGRRLGLVVRRLLLLQLAVEQRGHVVVAAVVAAAVPGLLPRHLAFLDVGLRLQQVIERLHLRRKRRRRLHRVERLGGLPHRGGGGGHVILFRQCFAGARRGGRRAAAALSRPPPRIPHRRLAERARCLFDARLQLRL